MDYLKKDLLPIETTRLVLRLLEPQEAGLMVDYVRENREHLAPWEPVRSEDYFSLEFWQNRLRDAQNEFFLGQSVRFAIFFKELPKGTVLGVSNFSNIIRGAFQACFLGYSVHYKYQGQGIMVEALTAGVEFMFDTLNLHRIMANYMPRNERSGRVLKKLGFMAEGFARDYLAINGQWEDHILTAKTKR